MAPLPARLAALLALALAAACDTAPPSQVFPDITFGHKPPILLNVRAVEVVSRYVSPLKAPNVEHRFPHSPEKVLRRWAQDRLKAVGREGTARFVIQEAGAVEAALAKEKGFKAAFTRQQSERYDAAVEAGLEILDARGQLRGYAAARATRSTTVAEDVSLLERERTWFRFTDELTKDFDVEIERQIREHLGGWMM
jgi:flagellar biosynthesis/type III secretory pathway protein FliH